MLSPTITLIIQIIVALGLLNVWLVRAGSVTPYRGGRSRTLREEFSTYGLPSFVFYLVGALKIGSAVLLIAGIWVGSLVVPAAALVALLMVGALAMHLRVGDPPKKSLPALLMLLMSVTLCAPLLT